MIGSISEKEWKQLTEQIELRNNRENKKTSKYKQMNNIITEWTNIITESSFSY